MNLVTGGTGLVGTHILIDLLKNEQEVRALKRDKSNLDIVHSVFKHYGCSNLFSKIDWVNGDVLDVPSLQQAVIGVKKVYHSAAIVSFNKKHFKKMYEVNVNGTANLVNVCTANKVEKIGHISSIAALGRDKSNQYSEETKWKNGKQNSYYAVTKNGAEREVWRGEQEGLNSVIVNPGIVFGPSNLHRSSTTLFKQVSKGLSRYTPGINGFVDVRDVSKSITQLMDSKICSERFILVAENLSYKDVFEKIALAIDKTPPAKEASRWMMQIAWRLERINSFVKGKSPTITKETALTACEKYYYDSTKIKERINYNFHSIDEAISNTADFLKTSAFHK